MKKVAAGFTLMELVVVIGIITVVIGSGMGIFYQSLRSGSKTDFEIFLDSSDRLIKNSMSSFIRYSTIVEVSAQNRDICLAAGANGVTGSSLTVNNSGKETTFSLQGDFISSDSASPLKQVNVSPLGIKINSLSFKWVCSNGERERVMVDYDAQAMKDGEPVPISKSYSFEILIMNSGYY